MPFAAWFLRCWFCEHYRDREVPATNLSTMREYPGAVTPACDHCEAGHEDPRVAE